jgi:hypothetical protein
MKEGEGKIKGFVEWEAKHRRCYKRILCGLKVHFNEPLRFITLTSVPDQKREIGKAFHVLHKRIKRLTVRSLVRSGYLSKKQASFYYGAEKKGYWDIPFRFEFIRVRTDEGVAGVFHLLFFGQYIPQEWLFDNWKECLQVDFMVKHSVDIRQCKSSTFDSKRLARYCVSQYVAGQDKFVKFYCSHWWVFPGFISDFNRDKAWFNRWKRDWPDIVAKRYGDKVHDPYFSFFYELWLPCVHYFARYEKVRCFGFIDAMVDMYGFK